MVQTIEANWPALALALLVVLLIAWWLLRRASSSARQRHHAPDALDEGAAPAARNQALIDAPSATAAALAGSGPTVMGGIGEAIAVGAADLVEAAPAAATPGAADDLSLIKGVGPKLVALLSQLGVTQFAQIAAWDEADIDRIDTQQGTFAGRIRRDSWVQQCRFLAAGDTAGFEGKFGRL